MLVYLLINSENSASIQADSKKTKTQGRINVFDNDYKISIFNKNVFQNYTLLHSVK